MGERTHPCGAPVLVVILDDFMFFSLTCCVRFERKLATQDTRYGLILKWFSLFKSRLGLIVLKAEEKSTKSILQYPCGLSKCL